MTLSDDEGAGLLGLVCEAASGNPAVNNAFFADLLRFQRILERQKKPGVSRAAIRSWRNGKASPRRGPALNFLHSYMLWVKSRTDASNWSDGKIRAFEKASTLIATLQPNPDNYRESAGSGSDGSAPLDATITMAVQTLLAINSRAPYSEHDAFFRGAMQEKIDDASYYMSFRYSTNNGAIVKSFTVVRKPIINQRATFIFNDFIGGGIDRGFIDHIYREIEGAIIKMEKSFYFIGSNFMIHADKKLDKNVFVKQRRIARWKPNGLSISAFEYDDVKLGPGLFGGLTMSVADVAQPLIARVAMLHLGIKSVLDMQLDDSAISPEEIAPEELANSLEETIISLKKAGAVRFGHRIEKCLAEKDGEKVGFKRLSDAIIKMIDVTPAWELKINTESNNKRNRSNLLSRGAIETIGSGRPRN